MFTKAEYQSLYMTEVPRWHATFQVLLKHKEKVGIYMATAPSWPNLAKGNTGTNVKALQCLLNYRNGNTALTVDGSFGPAVQNAVVTFQQSQGYHL